MSYRIPYPVRQKWSTEGQFRNPGNTLPMPYPENMPVGCWYGATLSLPNAVAGWATAGTDYTFVWKSPILDLRPELRGLPGGDPNLTNNVTQRRRDLSIISVPVWGNMKTLFVQVSNLQAANTNLTDMRFAFAESAGIKFAGELKNVVPLTTISEYFQTQSDSTVLCFQPYGGSHPYRYWQVDIQFRRVDGVTTGLGVPNPPYIIDAGCY
jgi:hypothetical protein